MPDTPTHILLEAITFLAALGMDVMLVPDAGRWGLRIGAESVTTDAVVAKAIGLGMLANAGTRH